MRPPKRPPVQQRVAYRPKRRKPPSLARTALVPQPLVPASDEQREKVAAATCLVCGRSPVDPAHLVPRSVGGCDHADCVIPLCRTHHRPYDRGELALLPYVGRGFRRERAHARMHVSAAALKGALRGDGWPVPKDS